jgi:outer membrane autotransporter protein
MYKLPRKSILLMGTALAGLGVSLFASSAYAQVVPLGTAEDFAIISAAGVTNTGNTIVNGNIALSPNESLTGFPPGIINGDVYQHSDPTGEAILARNDAFNAYNTLKDMQAGNGTNLSLENYTFTPGVYNFTSSAGFDTSLTLNAGGLAGARFVFQIASSLTTGVNSIVTILNAGATGPNVYWQVGSSATINGDSFVGNVVALESISLGEGVALEGRLIALTGAVTLINDVISVPEGGSSEGPSDDELEVFTELSSPDELTALYQTGFSAAEVRNTNIQRHLERVRSASGRNSETTYSVPADAAEPSDSKGGLGSKGGLSSGKNGLTQHTVYDRRDASNRSFFFEGANSSGSVDGSGLTNGYDFDRTGFTAGVDTRLSENFVVGLLGGYAQTDADLSSGGSMEAESYNAAVYATYYKGGFYLDGLLGAGLNSYDTSRASLGGYATGSTDGWQLESMLNTGYDIHRGNWSFGPLASVAFTRVNLDGFAETGSLTPLIFRDQHQDSLRTNLGAKIAYAARIGSVKITPQVRLAWQHEFLDSTQTMESQFAPGGAVSLTSGPNIDSDRLLVSAGLTVEVTPTVSLYGFYDGRLGGSDYKSNTVSAGVNIDF